MAPCFAMSRAQARPIPRDEPVIQAMRPDSRDIVWEAVDGLDTTVDRGSDLVHRAIDCDIRIRYGYVGNVFMSPSHPPRRHRKPLFLSILSAAGK